MLHKDAILFLHQFSKKVVRCCPPFVGLKLVITRSTFLMKLDGNGWHIFWGFFSTGKNEEKRGDGSGAPP